MNSATVVITTYNRPEALSCVLASLLTQACLPLEVVVADDGSGPETADCIAHWSKHAPFPIHHLWQADQGFRAAAARNRAIAQSSGSYLIFLDGDCMVFPDFIRRHSELAEPGWFVVGNRILLNPDLTDRIVQGTTNPLAWGYYYWLLARVRGEINRLLPLLRLPEGRWRKQRSRHWSGARTCNLAVWREDLLAINGFDEGFEGWGHEDADLVVRLFHLGRRRKQGHFAVPVLHLWHRQNDRSKEAANWARLQQVLGDRGAMRATPGLNQYLPPKRK
jgi:glycosyltransferase involved in cell wall biosynthesis